MGNDKESLDYSAACEINGGPNSFEPCFTSATAGNAEPLQFWPDSEITDDPNRYELHDTSAGASNTALHSLTATKTKGGTKPCGICSTSDAAST
ncbi:hypothetical protein PRIC1_010219 [Phytophthora ramorum]